MRRIFFIGNIRQFGPFVIQLFTQREAAGGPLPGGGGGGIQRI